LQHLVDARRTHQRASARATGIEEEHGELDCLLDEVLEEGERFKEGEGELRNARRARENVLVEGGRQARIMAMRRQTPSPGNGSGSGERSREFEEIGGDDSSSEIAIADTGNELTRNDVARKPRPHSTVEFGGNVEAQILNLFRISASNSSEQAIKQAEIESRRIEVEERRLKVEEDRELRLERSEERQARMEEMRITSQKAQTEMMMKMFEILQKKP
jgi:hypothetical protein